MSYTTIIAIWPGEKTKGLEELRNSHGSAPLVWNVMCKRYLGTKDHGYMFDETIEWLWPLWKVLNIPEYQRAVLMMTYDGVYILKKDYQRAAENIKAFLKDFPVKEGYANHWPRIAELLESQLDIPALGLHCTSVAENLFDGPWNEKKEEYDQPDWKSFYDIYSELDAI